MYFLKFILGFWKVWKSTWFISQQQLKIYNNSVVKINLNISKVLPDRASTAESSKSSTNTATSSASRWSICCTDAWLVGAFVRHLDLSTQKETLI